MNMNTNGPPQRAMAPSGGREPHAVGSVGATWQRVAFFDLDHTLIPFDSDYAWGAFTTERGWTNGAEFERRNDAFYEQYKAGTLDIHAYVLFSTEAIRRQGAIKSIAAHADFMRTVVQKGIQPQAQELVQKHQKAGDPPDSQGVGCGRTDCDRAGNRHHFGLVHRRNPGYAIVPRR
jgi:hypothetical protein